MTKVINLMGGSGVGKTAVASLLFGEMKELGILCEQAPEYVKKWAWEGRVPTPFDQMYIAGQQSRAESLLYGKVDYIVTDSPLLLSGFYEEYHCGRRIVLPSISNFLEYTKENNIKHTYFFLERSGPFDPRGRYETEEEALVIDQKLRTWMKELGYDFIEVPGTGRERVSFILERIKCEP